MTLAVVRHGQSLTNAEVHKDTNHQLGDINNVLTKEGVIGAIGAGMQLQSYFGENVNHIITSHLTRAKQTAFTIASMIGTGVPIIIDDEFEEIRWCSDRQYRDFDEYEGINDKKLYNDLHFRPLEDSENQMELFSRICAALIDHEGRFMDGNNILVTHYMVVRALMSLKETGGPTDMSRFRPENTKPYYFKPSDIEDMIRMARIYV